MPKYTVHFTGTASASVNIEAATEDDAIEAAYNDIPFSNLCVGCSGYSQPWDLDLDDNWEQVEIDELDEGAETYNDDE